MNTGPASISDDWQAALDSARKIAAQHHAATLRKTAAEIDEAAAYTENDHEHHGMERAAGIVRSRAIQMLRDAGALDVGPFYSHKDAREDTALPAHEPIEPVPNPGPIEQHSNPTQ